jgi:tetratricopeptide (TPR) repeat protein
MFKTKIKRKKDKEKLSIETIDDIKQKIIAHVKKDLKAANALLDELRQSYAETPHLLAETLSDIAQEFSNKKRKLALLEEAFKLNPDHPAVLNRYAYALVKFKPKQVEKAFELFERAVKIDPHHVKTFYKYGLALEKYDQAEKAFEMFDRALQLEPNNYKALNSYAIALTRHRRAEKAFEMFERSLQVNPSDTSTFNIYGKALADKGEFQKAFEMFERSLQVDANDIIMLTSYGKALADKGAFEKAFDMFERSLQVDANNTIALTSYGKALAEKGAFQKAFEMFDRSLQVNANNTIALNSYGYALAANNDFQKSFELFEKSLQVKSDDYVTLFMYATVLEAAQKYEEAISHLEKIIRLDDPSLGYRRQLIFLKLGQLCYLAKQETKGKKYFDWVIKNAIDIDVGRLEAAEKLLAVKPYSQEATDLLRKIIETSPNHTQALRMLSLDLKPEDYFERFKTSAESALTDTEMLNRAIYHKIFNEISMLKVIAYQIVKDDRASEVLSKVIKSIESTYEKMTQRRHEEKTKVEQMPTDNYQKIVAIISQTAHDVVDIANNQLAIIKARLQRVLKKLNQNQKDRLFYKLEKLLQRIESTETALNDLKSVNEGINLHKNTFKSKTLFEPWQTTPTLEHATLSFNIQNGDSEFVGDKEKIKSFLSELMENALKHNPDQPDLHIHISSEDIDSASHNTSKTLRKKILSANAKKSLLITFSDNGKGIPPERKEPIFLALESTSKEGSGLGLFIIKRTLEKMKGHIIETGTQGARFEIDIPYGEQ